MRRVLAILPLMFAHSWPVGLMSGTAVLFLVIGVFVGPLFVMGNVFAVFSILWASSAFRQLISNRRLSMLPRFRVLAVAALMVVTVAIGGAAALAAVLNPGPAPAADAIGMGLLAFAVVSAYCLLGQWGSTSRAVLLQLLLWVLVLRFVVTGRLDESTVGENAWALSLPALIGWAWLLVSVQRNARLAGPHPSLRIENTAGLNPNSWTAGEMLGFGPLDLGRPSHSAGTLMRGANDSWINRVGVSLFWVLGFGLLWMLWMYAVADPPGWSTRDADRVVVFLTVSFMATAAQAPMRFFDWPARLRYIWLRTAGDRIALWRMLERSIAAEALTVAAIAAVASAAIFHAFGTSIRLLATYVLGITVATLIGAYGAMGMRISGASVTAVGVCASLGWAPVLWLMLAAGPEPAVLNSLLVMTGVLTVIFRHAARRMFVRMDWCAVKPSRNAFVRSR